MFFCLGSTLIIEKRNRYFKKVMSYRDDILLRIRISIFRKTQKRNPPFLREGRSKDTILRGVRIRDKFH